MAEGNKKKNFLGSQHHGLEEGGQNPDVHFTD